MQKDRLTIQVAGKELVFETGKIARQANGSVMLTCGDTVILATACANKSVSPDIDFFPLRVDYQEKFSSAGKTLGGFIKREGKPSEKETLTSRLIDRPLRPLFPEGFFNEVQILTYVLSYDPSCQPDALAICAASAALTISDIPFPKPVGGVRVGKIGSDYIINPTLEEMQKSSLDLLIAGTEDAILMIEGYCDFLTEEQVLEAISEGHKAIKQICQGLLDWRNLVGKEKFEAPLILPPSELLDEIENLIKDKFKEAFFISDKQSREEAFGIIDGEIYAHFSEDAGDQKYSEKVVKRALKQISSKLMRHHILASKKRADGRSLTDIRNILIETSILPRTHGSALFTRGETQAIAVCTLGGSSMGQRYEDLDTKDSLRKFYLQYSFPPFSVGEVGPLRSPGRREIGHGKLAEKSLQAVIPSEKENFPYTIRLESNITESNGSSSMASVCGGCLALMDAGVPIKRPIAGIAMGLLLEETKFAILSDILGMEDALGDMDFKVSGDGEGITAFQMDIKVEGITLEIMKAALHQAKEGRIHILGKMLEACPKSRQALSPFAPRIESLTVKPSKIAVIIGPGGKMIRSIIEESGAEIDINDEGVVNIAATNATSLQKAKDLIINLISDIEIGKTYKGPIMSIQPFGVFVRLPGAKDGLCHISEFSHERIENMGDHAKEGDEIEVKVLDINDRGQIKLSRKVLISK
ncbi:MAG: polyribonucleotide nucleotidyltransferase [Chlamydiae bacterium]|jgi:polyribonucleotide nucleotidyltransferase|nr:polyribonucleotide nucleotidyltransferase [Chlamydiota bacterium]